MTFLIALYLLLSKCFKYLRMNISNYHISITLFFYIILLTLLLYGDSRYIYLSLSFSICRWRAQNHLQFEMTPITKTVQEMYNARVAVI